MIIKKRTKERKKDNEWFGKFRVWSFPFLPEVFDYKEYSINIFLIRPRKNFRKYVAFC